MSTIVSSLCVLFLVILSIPVESRIAKDTRCGQVKLKSEKVVKHGTLEMEYIPSSYVTKNTERYWVRSDNTGTNKLKLGNGTFEQTQEQNNKYVSTIYMLNVSMNGRYGVYCSEFLLYTNMIAVTLPEPPSIPVIIGLQDIENCTDCLVGEDNNRIALKCEIHGGSHPLYVTITVGNESYPAQKFRSTTYNVFFLVKDHHHMENVTFSVMNDALSSPLSVTAQMFVIKPPTFHFSVPEILTDGEAVTCTLEGGRPNPNVYVSISGLNVSSAHHFYNRTTSLNTNIVTLTTFKREWNKQLITCCRYNKWYAIGQKCSLPERVNYLFPPSSVMLEVKVDGVLPSQMYAKCTVYGSNPACNVQIRAPSGIIGSKRSSGNISQPHGAWNSMYAVNLNVNEKDNGKDVKCIVVCEKLSINITETVKILLPKPPVIKFNISGSTLNISEEERAHVKCVAESVPASNISWIEELSNGTISKKQCDLTPNCVFHIDANKVSKRRFICRVHYKTKVDHKYLTVYIERAEEDKKYNNKEKATGQESDNSIIWIIVGAGVLLVVIIVIVVLFVVIRKKSQTLEDKREGRVHHHTQEGHARCTIQKSEDRPAGNQNEHALDNEAKENRQEGNLKQSGNRIHDDDDVPIYSQPVKKKTTENPDNIYAQVNKTRKSASSPSSANSSKIEKDGQLLYADLAFDPNAASSKAAVAKQEDSPTEYVDIDYVKTKANKEIDDDPTEQENL